MDMSAQHTEQRYKMLDALSRSLSPRQYRAKIFIWQQTIAWTRRAKRLFDYLVTSIALVLCLPIFVATAFLIYLENPGPIFYSQIRVGKDGRHFRFFKFRSMVVGADTMKVDLGAKNESKDGIIFKMKDDPRVTKTGKVIRKFSIDELPQLFNVLRGDMSLVGPRPALPGEVAMYTLEQRKRLHALPGITCIWQVSGRSDIPFTGQVHLDLEYIKSTSMRKDISILLRTIPAVLAGKGAY
jgi:lipopolysaccharide/colanic/teichoic acid biosynthesis glycosyltransferase